MMEDKEKTYYVPEWFADTFDYRIRRFFMNPEKIVSPHLAQGDTALDIGCGMGFFSIAMAKLVGPGGKIYAVDIQQTVLDGVARRARKRGIENRIVTVLTDPYRFEIDDMLDFAVGSWIMHELPDQPAFLEKLSGIMRPGARFLVMEPKFHVTEREFLELTELIRNHGFAISGNPRIAWSRSILFEKT